VQHWKSLQAESRPEEQAEAGNVVAMRPRRRRRRRRRAPYVSGS
jgi:hypothetical protein